MYSLTHERKCKKCNNKLTEKMYKKKAKKGIILQYKLYCKECGYEVKLDEK